MSSKEALLKLCFKYLPTVDEMYLNFDEEDEELLKVIQKDLEILEILKPKLSVEKGSTWEYLEVKHPFFDTQDEIDKLKEWLRNE